MIKEKVKIIEINRETIDFKRFQLININIDIKILNEIISEYIFSNDILENLFSQRIENNRQKINMLKRFVFDYEFNDKNIDWMVKKELENRKFYSFFAEALQASLLYTFLNFEFKKCVLEIHDTLTTIKTDLDTIMYSKNNNSMILNESKFYIDFKPAIEDIIKNFENFTITKWSSLTKVINSENYENKEKILNLNNELGNSIEFLDAEKMKNIKLMFCGFVLHEIKKNNNYDNEYSKTSFDIEKLKSKIKNFNKGNEINEINKLIIFHLPIKSKSQLISKIIISAKTKISELSNE